MYKIQNKKETSLVIFPSWFRIETMKLFISQMIKSQIMKDSQTASNGTKRQ